MRLALVVVLLGGTMAAAGCVAPEWRPCEEPREPHGSPFMLGWRVPVVAGEADSLNATGLLSLETHGRFLLVTGSAVPGPGVLGEAVLHNLTRVELERWMSEGTHLVQGRDWTGVEAWQARARPGLLAQVCQTVAQEWDAPDEGRLDPGCTAEVWTFAHHTARGENAHITGCTTSSPRLDASNARLEAVYRPLFDAARSDAERATSMPQG